MAATGEAWRLGRRPALDGLRGIAIVLVVISHAIGPAGSRLGQVGVSMFFTLSGFLIAARLSEEHAATGRIIFRAFYLGRARRLLPALLACVAVCGLTAWLVGSWFARPREVVAALLYATNWLSLASGAPHGALSHTWSLAIEEQFYVVWPAVFAVLAARRRGAVWLTALVSAGILGSLAVRLAHGPGELDRDLFGSDARAGEVLIGVLLALVLSRVARVTGWWSQVTPAGVGACVAVACAPGPWVATWGLLLVPSATALVILGCVGSDESGWLQASALRWLGVRSYGIYLWHHPVAWLVGDMTLSPAERLVLVFVLGLALAEVSWRCVEAPFLQPRNQDQRAPRSQRDAPRRPLIPVR